MAGGAGHEHRGAPRLVGPDADEGAVAVVAAVQDVAREAGTGAPGTGAPGTVVATDLELLGAEQDDGPPCAGGCGAAAGANAADGVAAEPTGRVVTVDFGGYEVGVADHAGEIGVGGLGVELAWRGVLGDRAVAKNGHGVGGSEGLTLVVGDENGGGARRAQDAQHIGSDTVPQRGVKGGEGFVKQDHVGPDGERTRQRHPSLLAAGQLVGMPPCEAAQADEFGQHLGVGGPAPPWQPEPDVGLDIQMREQRAVLWDIPDAPALRRDEPPAVVDRGAAQPHDAFLGAFETGDHPQQRCLTAAGGAEYRRHRARLDV